MAQPFPLLASARWILLWGGVVWAGPLTGSQTMAFVDHPGSGTTLSPTADSGPVIRQALADLDRLDRCLETGESAGPNRATEVDLQRLRTLYILAIEDEDRVEEAHRVRRELAARPWGDSPEGRSVLAAYHGALEMLEAKHGFWPNARMGHLRTGLRLLDEEVEARPRGVEVRYLRLVSTAFLPGILGRSSSVREDLAVLSHLLPAEADRFPMRTFDAMASTLLELLPEDAPEREAIEDSLERAFELGRPLAPSCRGA